MELARLPLFGQGALADVLIIRDPRRRNGMQHPGRALLTAAVCATLSGCRSFKAIAEWIADQPEDVRRLLGFNRARPPSQKTVRTFLQRIDSERLAKVVGEWLATQLGRTAAGAVAMDGKVLRGSRQDDGSAVQLVSAVTHLEGVTLGQTAVEGGNEINAVQRLISALDLDDMTVTLDALHTQRETAALIVHVKNADYVMTVKGNQPGILEELTNAPMAAFSPSA